MSEQNQKNKDASKWDSHELGFLTTGIIIGVITVIFFVWLINLPPEIVKQNAGLMFAAMLVSILFAIIAAVMTFMPVWDRVEEKTQDSLRKKGGVLFAALVIILMFFHPFIIGGQAWSGEGIVNIFPVDDSSKNYRVPAEIRVKTGLWGSREYEVDNVEWKDGGATSFSSCTITNDNDMCYDDESREWKVEVYQAPDYDPPVN